MRERIILFLSLGVSVFLAGMLFLLRREGETKAPAPFNFEAASALHSPASKTNVIIRRQHFTWSEVESTNYSAYIANLRRIDCPEETIRDIIVADVDHLYEQRKLHEVVLPDQQWWRSEPDMDVIQSASTQFQALDAEKNALLTQLLGPNWNWKQTLPERDVIRLDGPVLSQLSPETKASLFKIAIAARDKAAEYQLQKQANGEQADPLELAKIRDQTRSDLSRILTPEQLEEYLLRYSYNASQMRDQLLGFDASSNEFRTIFRSRDSYDQQIAALGESQEPSVIKRRQELESQRDSAVQQALGPDRASMYAMTQNPLFREAQTEAEKNGIPPEKVLPIFQINQASQIEMQRIKSDTTLSEQDRAAALQAVVDQQQASIKKIVEGEAADAPPPLPPP